MEQPVITVYNYVDVIGSYCYTYVTIDTYVTKKFLHMCYRLNST